MKKIHHYHTRFRLSMIRTWCFSLLICAFLLPSYVEFEKTGDNFFTIILNGVTIGNVGSREDIDEYMIEARKEFVSDSEDLVFIDTDLQVTGQEVLWGEIDSKDTIIKRMKNVLSQNTIETLQRAYTVKINERTVNLASYEEVDLLLQKALENYDTKALFDAELILDDSREVNVLTTQISAKNEVQTQTDVRYDAGIAYDIEQMLAEVEPSVEKDFDDYQQGLIDIAYADTIEVIEAYLLEEQLTPVEEAIDLLTKEQEMQVIYKVVSGDTLSKIAYMNNIPLEDLIAMNDEIDDEFSTIRVDQELIITVPEPDLSILWQDEQIYVEDYEAEVQYVPNDNWYTTQQVTLQAPSAGRRKVVAVTTYKNSQEISREILKEEIYAEAVPKIVERGTKIPPTYVKPISGGRLSSGFGARSAPTKGASTNHQGVDWATPIGTPVVASNGGTVTAAGWMSGYGYAVFISHADGRQTRYGHLSKVLVSAGQTVSQGQRIALSGNSGRSTGPHLHFEIRINGTAVNPLKYLK